MTNSKYQIDENGVIHRDGNNAPVLKKQQKICYMKNITNWFMIYLTQKGFHRKNINQNRSVVQK